MNKLYSYDFYDISTNSVPLDHPYKERYYFGDNPEANYTEVTGDELAAYHTAKYPERRKDAINFADAMNGRIASNKVDGVDTATMDVINNVIDTTFNDTEVALRNGKWKTAQRRVSELVANQYVSQSLIDEVALTINTYVSLHY